MSRPLRIEYPNAWYHVMNRGRRKELIFKSKDDYMLFLEVIHEAIELFALRVSAYCLMPNHYHLLVQTPDANLSRCMRHINGVYTQRYNSKHSFDGQLFRGRYKAIVVAEDTYLLQLIRYIHRNPVRSRQVEKVEHYEWSSHKGYLSKAKKWNWLYKDFILSMLSVKPQKRNRAYQSFMGLDEDDDFLRMLSLKKLPSIIGDNKFIEDLKTSFFEQKQHIDVPESKSLAPNMDRIKQKVCEYYSIDSDQLHFSKRAVFNEARAVAVYLSRYLRGESLKSIGEQFEINNYSTVSTIIERFKERLRMDKALSLKVDEIRLAIKSQEQT
ncbi:transposase [Candidatus Magnetomorum sp. HK-1]|nr:transposase [Candidatus Magnetomorum sp. HK-1]